MGKFASALLASASLLFIAAAEARDFRSSDVHPPGYPTVEAVKRVGALIAEQTQGRYGVRVYPSGTLGNEKDMIEQVKLGGLDMMRINVAPLNNIVPETLVTALPFVFRSVEHMRASLDGPVGDEILAAMSGHGMIGLAFYDSGARSFYTVARPIRTVDDMKGMKIRVQQSDLFVAMLDALGANATPLPYGEVFTALKTGIVDGAENNWPSYETARHFEAAKHYSLSEHSMAPEMLVFSKRIWDTLDPADQAIVKKAAKDSVPYMRSLWEEREVAARRTVEAAGVEVVEIADKQPFIDRMQPVYARFAGKEPLAGLVQRIQETK